MPFSCVTVFVLASNETDLLRETIAQILENIPDAQDLDRIVVVAKSSDCPACSETLRLLHEYPDWKLELYVQKTQGIARCISELPALVGGSHFIIISADLEMDPRNIRTFLAAAKNQPDRIVSASKWMPGSTVIGYGRFHALCAKSMNRFVGALFHKRIYDAFTLYKIYPVVMIRRLRFDRPQTMPYELMLKPLKYGFAYREIPTVYQNRQAGKSNFRLGYLFTIGVDFCATAVRLRFFE